MLEPHQTVYMNCTFLRSFLPEKTETHHPKMGIVYFLVVLLFWPSLLASFPDTTVFNTHEDGNFRSLVEQACKDIDAHDSCISNIQTHIEKSGRGRNPRSVLTAAIKAAHDEAKHAVEGIPTFTTLSISFREQVAIDDCKELLDFSVTELAWSMAEMSKIRQGKSGPDSGGNLKAWLSAALSNQDTCLEGFEGTDRKLETLLRGSLRQVTQLISNVLELYTQLNSLPFKPSRNETLQNYKNTPAAAPEWLSELDESLVQADPRGMNMNAVVAQDGSGKYRTITEAIDEAPNHSNTRYVIYVKKGVYKENIDMKKKKTNIMMVGDGIGQTIITGDRNFLQGLTTFRTATVAVSGKGFIARDITFRNMAGPKNHQAVALRVDSDQSAFFRCSMEGYQDTLYAHSLRQFYRECEIYGTIDFIFGNGAAVLQNCKIYTRAPLPLQKVTITAQGRKNPNQNTGFVIQNSYVLATQPTYLGRPWKLYSRTVYMSTYMSQMVQPRGWLEWFGNFALDTLWYGEYKNYGPGSAQSSRVKWAGFHFMDRPAAEFFTVGSFVDGRRWLPATGVRFTAGLTN
ncbi:PREDICTED: putative pectinesterase/pectinesterase inhibitor 22 [Tarenaya hassleriana]|uniref:putative pectinesterase/pectinesterase inhibitor 22 n=1 Tax=Tarenaya hassleriana TaxID=28532 RepID=UPI00053C2A03|nr:PREDICTED: putative pectinesterase/pectinesterase inhibitor 22 [Tarenaya hassleriana]